MSEVKQENETVPSSNGEMSASDWATVWILALIMCATFGGAIVLGKAQSEARTSQAYEQQEQEDAARDLDNSLQDSLTREEAEEEIATEPPMKVLAVTPALDDCQAVSWTFPAELMATMEHVGTDSKGVDRYEVWYGYKGLHSPEVIAYIAEHPELKPEPTTYGCDAELELDPSEATPEGISSDMWIEPLATGTSSDESK